LILKETLRNVIKLQRDDLRRDEKIIKRDLLDKIDRESRHIIIISGIRRCGKSTLLLEVMQTSDNFYYFNFEDPRTIHFEVTDFEKMDQVFHEEFGESESYFFDEIQNVPQWERFVRALQDKGKKIFITGSNASLLSRELGTRLTGRHLSYELFPFSFNEMTRLTGQVPSLSSFEEYMHHGGFPEFLKYRNTDILHQLFQDIISRDIITRYKIREHRILIDLAIHLLSNSGNEFTFNRLKNQFSLGSTNTAISYLSYLEESYLLFTIPKFDFSFAKQRVHAKKVYSIDPGLSRANTASLTPDKGRVLENIVLLELLRQQKKVFYLKNNFECDFIVLQNNTITEVYQVCYQLNDENLRREFDGLHHAKKLTGAKSGFILTYDQEDEISGFPVLPVWKWCLEKG
jgi:predicted AAA+ superfamily ATPase